MAFCSKCGTQIGEGEKFCPSCGNPVDGPVVTSGSNETNGVMYLAFSR